jgi:hypothetical protein
MGLIDGLLEHVSVTTVLLVAVAGYIFYRVSLRVEKHYRLRRLGARANIIHNKLPFGNNVSYT